MRIIISATITGKTTSDATNDDEYDGVVCVAMYTQPMSCPMTNATSSDSNTVSIGGDELGSP